MTHETKRRQQVIRRAAFGLALVALVIPYRAEASDDRRTSRWTALETTDGGNAVVYEFAAVEATTVSGSQTVFLDAFCAAAAPALVKAHCWLVEAGTAHKERLTAPLPLDGPGFSVIVDSHSVSAGKRYMMCMKAFVYPHSGPPSAGPERCVPFE